MEENIHLTHCNSCFLLTCSFKKHCPFIFCEYGCGLYFHQCKVTDHQNCCVKYKRPCINFFYGCNLLLNTEELRNHLPKCSAGTVICTMEWNRRPSIKTNDVDSIPSSLSKNNFSLITTLKDQHILFESAMKSQNMKSYAEEIIKEYNKQIKLKLSLNPVESKDSPVTSSKKILCQTSKARQLPRSFYRFDFCENLIYGSKLTRKTYTDVACDTSDFVTDLSNCQSLFPKAEVDKNEHILATLLTVIKNEHFYNRNPISESYCLNHFVRMVSTQTFPCDLLEIDVSKFSLPLKESFFDDSIENDMSYVIQKSHNNFYYSKMVLDNTMECLSRIVTNTNNMFSYMCGQIFRRDEFCWHYQNCHCDFYGGLDNWIEQSCSYSNYGCKFKQHRFLPNSHNCELAFNADRSCIVLRENEKLFQNQPVSFLIYLPVEIIESIIFYLDSYSIGQLMLTCTYLKNLCLTFLKNRGIVDVVWKKREFSNGYKTWQIDKYKCFFSNSISPIKKWIFKEQPSMANHVNNCPYAVKSYASKYYKPVKVFGF